MPPLLTDDDCYYRLRILRITTEDRRSWKIAHYQYLAWGDHGKINFQLKDFEFLFSFEKIHPTCPINVIIINWQF